MAMEAEMQWSAIMNAENRRVIQVHVDEVDVPWLAFPRTGKTTTSH